MDDLSFDAPAIKINQREKEGQAIYLALIKAKDLVHRQNERFDISIYERKKIEGGYKDVGYQRRPNPNKIKQIKNFITNESKGHPLFPTAIITSTEAKLKFEEVGDSLGKLHILPKLHIIDGQHRMQAWIDLMKSGSYTDLENYEIPVVILSGFTELEEVIQFHIINSRQTKIKTDLAHNHYLRLMNDDKTKNLVADRDKWIPRANIITKSLNEKNNNIWFEKMFNANDTSDIKKRRPIALSSFTSSLKPFFARDRVFYSQLHEDKNTKILVDYWDKIAQVWSAALEVKSTGYLSYVLMKTVGVFSMHYLLAHFLEKKNDSQEAIDQAYKALKLAYENGMDDSYWFAKKLIAEGGERDKSGRYAMAHSSGSGHMYIVDYILSFQNNK